MFENHCMIGFRAVYLILYFMVSSFLWFHCTWLHFSIISDGGLLKLAHPKVSLYFTRFEVLTVMLWRSRVFWDVMLCCSAKTGLLASEGEGTTVLWNVRNCRPHDDITSQKALMFSLSFFLCPPYLPCGYSTPASQEYHFIVCCVCKPSLFHPLFQLCC